MLDLEALKLKPNAAGKIKIAPLLITLPTRKPTKEEYFRIRPGAEWMMEFPIYESKGGTGGENKNYLVMPEFQSELEERKLLKPVRFYLGIVWTTNILFLSEVGIKNNKDGVLNSWNKSRIELYELAKEKWISISSNDPLGAYCGAVAKSNLEEPVWPDKPANIGEAIELAFKNNVIDNPNHPILKKLRGEI